MTDDTASPALPAAKGPDMMGRYWVQLSPEMARSHPMGRPGLVIYLIAGWFVCLAIIQVLFLGVGLGMLVALFYLMIGLALVLGAPWSRIIAILFCIFGFGAPGGLLMSAPVDDAIMWLEIVLGFGVLFLNLFIIFYLFDGERPNLVYAHRYRSYRAEDAVEKGN